jgi:hypothetical protein
MAREFAAHQLPQRQTAQTECISHFALVKPSG